MSAVVPTRQAYAFHHASDLPEEVWHVLSEDEAAANVILPFAQKASNLPREGDHKNLWIASYDDAKNVELVLSCTRGPLGDYPIFIVASKSFARAIQEGRRDEDLADASLQVARRLLSEDGVPPRRVFSVFSIAKVSEAFARLFVAEAHVRGEHAIEAHERPYYDATFTFCTGETFDESLSHTFRLKESEDFVVGLRRADMSHLEKVKKLCKAFSEGSPPYELDDARAELEAETMIKDQHVWVHMVRKDDRDQEPDVACLVATTRESDNVTAVTKVFTAEDWRGRGCASLLLHRVCQEILQKKKRVVLYVGNSDEMKPARKVYDKIGFQGLTGVQPQGQRVEGVERWVEIGFKGTDLGYW